MKVAVVTDSNSGITQAQAKEMGVYVLPMPFMIDGTEYLEDINLTQKEFYEHLSGDHDVSTSQPSPETILNLWEKLLEEYDAVVHIPMSSGLSSSCQTAKMLADDFDGKVQVADNHRISAVRCRMRLTWRQPAWTRRRFAKSWKRQVWIQLFMSRLTH